MHGNQPTSRLGAVVAITDTDASSRASSGFAAAPLHANLVDHQHINPKDPNGCYVTPAPTERPPGRSPARRVSPDNARTPAPAPVHTAAPSPAFFAKPFAALFRSLTRRFRACTPGPLSAGLLAASSARWPSRPSGCAVRCTFVQRQPSHGTGSAGTSGRPPAAILPSRKNPAERPPSRPSIAGGCSTRLAGSPIQ